MGIRDKKINGVHFDKFLSIDKVKEGVYTLKKLNGTTVEKKLARNIAGALQNFINRSDKEKSENSTPQKSEDINSLSSSAPKSKLFNPPSVDKVRHNIQDWMGNTKFKNPELIPWFPTAEKMTQYLSSGLFEIALPTDLTEDSLIIFRTGNPGTDFSPDAPLSRQGHILLKTTKRNVEIWNKATNPGFSKQNLEESVDGRKENGIVIRRDMSNVR